MSLVTAPKPEPELAGLVYSETPVKLFGDPEDAGKPWYLKPVPLAGVMVSVATVLPLPPVLATRPLASPASDRIVWE